MIKNNSFDTQTYVFLIIHRQIFTREISSGLVRWKNHTESSQMSPWKNGNLQVKCSTWYSQKVENVCHDLNLSKLPIYHQQSIIL